MKKKDISDSNVYGGSEDEEDLQNVAIASNAKRMIKQANSSNNSLDDSGIIQDEAPIQIAIDSLTLDQSTNHHNRGGESTRFIAPKIGKVGMSEINCGSSCGWVSTQRPNAMISLSFRESNGVQTNLDTIHSRMDKNGS